MKIIETRDRGVFQNKQANKYQDLNKYLINKAPDINYVQ